MHPGLTPVCNGDDQSTSPIVGGKWAPLMWHIIPRPETLRPEHPADLTSGQPGFSISRGT